MSHLGVRFWPHTVQLLKRKILFCFIVAGHPSCGTVKVVERGSE